MRNVTLYVDVDGVICPFGPAGRSEWGSEWRRAEAGLLPVAYAQELVDGLNSLAAQPDVRFIWLTSWEEMAAQYLCPAIGLNGSRWPHLAADGGNTGAGWWKLAALQADLERSNPERIVWIDDQLRFEQEAQAWARFLGARILLVSPDPRLGISPGELAAVHSFLTPPTF
ncbi:HAD domain-containing protein [Arthrobacter sp. B6]|uniref:HAD domain-containing protein n=1 Tax=Arthrobacter sp. B6 TaxID=1570137 RepID=UPI00082D67F0|nr:HAD domain-containing protein [Arthrobacter sp. B6]